LSADFYEPFLQWANTQPQLTTWDIRSQIDESISVSRWGDLPQWQQVLDDLPALNAADSDFTGSARIGLPGQCDDITRDQLQTTLMGLHPWRKGPYELFGLPIDTEWRSDWKWDRVLPHLAPMQGRRILDVGCGNGYHCWRMYGAGAERVIGIDPSVKFVYQFYALKHFAGELPIDVLPLGIEQVPSGLAMFDTVFSMGVLYHRRDPVEHIQELLACLKPGGQLVLETLMIDSEGCEALVPEGRYAKMRNVWNIPSGAQMLEWLKQAGLENPRLVDTNQTSLKEQRRTDWMRFESLADFLDPTDPNRTIEGHPAPLRGIFIAEKGAR
jgi:tRNA (mo5U34)-methyltransferase